MPHRAPGCRGVGEPGENLAQAFSMAPMVRTSWFRALGPRAAPGCLAPALGDWGGGSGPEREDYAEVVGCEMCTYKQGVSCL